ncbi:MAG: hypothetical protein ACR2P2_00735 [Nakamurella sp.]
MIHLISGLPAHLLLVHAVVVFVPVAALLIVLSAAWPAARRKLGIITPIIALITLVMVPITTSAGHWLLDRLSFRESNALVMIHANLGDDLLAWVIGMFAGALLVWGLPWLAKRDKASQLTGNTWIGAGIGLLAVAASVVAVVQVVRISEAGSRAVWSGTQICTDPVAPGGQCTSTLGQ